MSGAGEADDTRDTGRRADLVRVWLVDSDDLSRSALTDLHDVLDDDERRRADCLTLAEGRRRFIVAHGAARFIVAERLGAPPRELCWKIGQHGKPELAGPWTGVRVNISHSGGVCLVAVSESRHVGVDVQRLVPGLDVIAMARRYFCEEESRLVVEGRDADDQAETFAWLWARKEAVVKADGGRLTQVLPLPMHDAGEMVVTIPEPFRVADIPVPRGFKAAVALSGREPFEVVPCRWSWSRDR